jgi:hypothetical protein
MDAQFALSEKRHTKPGAQKAGQTVLAMGCFMGRVQC